jgi:hypothetical protein
MGRLVAIASVLSLPPTVAHEATHWAVARCGTDDAAMAVEVRGGRALAAWPPIESTALRVFAFLAPTVFGSILALLWLWRGVDLTGWRLLFGVGLAIYTVPSPADIRGALGIQDSQQETDDNG